MSTHGSPNPPMGDGNDVKLSSQNAGNANEPHLEQDGFQHPDRTDGVAFSALAERLRPECERIVAQYEQSRSALLPIMHLFQDHEGYVSAEAIRFAADLLQLSPAVVESTVSFYTLFFRKPVGKYMVQVCRGLMCAINGAGDVMAAMRERLGVGNLETTGDGLVSYEEVECLAACDRPTCLQVNLEFVYDVTPAVAAQIVDELRCGTYKTKPMVQTREPGRTWAVKQDAQVASGRKSPGARDVSRPNNAGGLGDKDGVIMLDRFVTKGVDFTGRTSERLVRDATGVAEVVAEGNGHHAGH